MFSKILVASRGEIAIRAFRAAVELGAQTVAVYPFEDRGSVHRQKADEAFEIGTRGQPVAAYLDVHKIVRVAAESGAEAFYPRLWLSLGEPGAAASCGGHRAHVRRAARRGPRADRPQ